MTKRLIWPENSNPSYVSLMKDLLDNLGVIWTEDSHVPNQVKVFLIRPEHEERVRFFCDPTVLGLEIEDLAQPHEDSTDSANVSDLASGLVNRAVGKLADVGWLSYSSRVRDSIGRATRHALQMDLFDEAIMTMETRTASADGTETHEFTWVVRRVKYTELKARYRFESSSLAWYRWTREGDGQWKSDEPVSMPEVQDGPTAVLKFGQPVTAETYWAARREAAVPADAHVMVIALAKAEQKRAIKKGDKK